MRLAPRRVGVALPGLLEAPVGAIPPVRMVAERDVRLSDGRTLRTYDSGGADAGDRFTVVWHHGSPQIGAPLQPLLAAAAARGIRLLSYGRPSYGGSSPLPGRDVASAAADVRSSPTRSVSAGSR